MISRNVTDIAPETIIKAVELRVITPQEARALLFGDSLGREEVRQRQIVEELTKRKPSREEMLEANGITKEMQGKATAQILLDNLCPLDGQVYREQSETWAKVQDCLKDRPKGMGGWQGLEKEMELAQLRRTGQDGNGNETKDLS